MVEVSVRGMAGQELLVVVLCLCGVVKHDSFHLQGGYSSVVKTQCNLSP